MTRTLKVTLTAFLITVFVGWSNPRVFSADEVFYAWEDASGNRYVTVQSQKAVNPETIYPNHPEIQFIAVDVKSPIRLRPGFQSHTYRFVKQSGSSNQTTIARSFYSVGLYTWIIYGRN